MSDQAQAALKLAEDSLYDVRQAFESADDHRLNGGWIAERTAVQATRAAIERTIQNLTTLKGLI